MAEADHLANKMENHFERFTRKAKIKKMANDFGMNEMKTVTEMWGHGLFNQKVQKRYGKSSMY
jgi:hypothetical protein